MSTKIETTEQQSHDPCEQWYSAQIYQKTRDELVQAITEAVGAKRKAREIDVALTEMSPQHNGDREKMIAERRSIRQKSTIAYYARIELKRRTLVARGVPDAAIYWSDNDGELHVRDLPADTPWNRAELQQAIESGRRAAEQEHELGLQIQELEARRRMFHTMRVAGQDAEETLRVLNKVAEQQTTWE